MPITRFHITLFIAANLAALAVASGNWLWLVAVVVVMFLVIGLGVAIPQMKFFGPFICDGKTSKKQVALTFDDGPDARSTPALLDLLREQRVEAAFFCIGKRVAAEPALAQRILAEGHMLENHSFAHSNTTNFFTVPQLIADLSQAQAAIQAATGHTPKLFRPPVGLSNPNVFRAAKTLGLRVVGWSIRSLDTKITEPEKVVARIERGLKPGAIILLHDGNIPAERLLVTVKLLLTKLREHGYEVVRLDTLIG
jgi:peptidoglycan/xylan/chitin deacetylase (PgdA/CDA1 family)